MKPQSCDTFVVLPPATAKGNIVFGKNSDRPAGEVQEVVYLPEADYNEGTKLQCTYIQIDQVTHTHSVILSKPSWMWGAEMGANEHGVCIGNEAVWTKLNGPHDNDEKLLGMDLVRLGLERSSNAKEALEVITQLLEQHGQGGPCSDIITDMTYHNSFLIVDRKEAWVLETANEIWAAEQITNGFRNISNCLSIGTKIDLHSSNLREYAQSAGLWDPSQGDLNFSTVYGDESGDTERFECGKELLEKLSDSGQFKEKDMFAILRDRDSGICMSTGGFRSTGSQLTINSLSINFIGEFDLKSMLEVLRDRESGICRGKDDHKNPTAGSQVSVLSPEDSKRPACHWFTGTPDPVNSVFKPFIFCSNVRISRHIISPTFPDDEDPAKVTPRFKSKVDRKHNLYKHHEKAYNLMNKKTEEGASLRATMRNLEATCIRDVENFLDNFKEDNTKEVEDLFKDVVETEIKFYK